MEKKNRSYKYKIVIQWDEKRHDFFAMAPEFGNCAVRAPTQKEAIDLVNDAIERHLNGLEKEHLPFPRPFSEKEFSGRLSLRIDANLHRDIAMQAAAEGVPIAHFIERQLRKK